LTPHTLTIPCTLLRIISNWMEFYPGASEEIPKDLTPEKGPRVRMTVYVDADNFHEFHKRVYQYCYKAVALLDIWGVVRCISIYRHF
jgi:hypothetical protein